MQLTGVGGHDAKKHQLGSKNGCNFLYPGGGNTRRRGKLSTRSRGVSSLGLSVLLFLFSCFSGDRYDFRPKFLVFPERLNA